MGTNVPAISFGPNGPVIPNESAIRVGMQADWNAAFQTSFNFGTSSGSGTNSTPQGQIVASETAVVGNQNNAFAFLASMFDPAFATGRYQDALARLYFLTRIPSQPTVLQVVCSGLDQVSIPIGAQVKDASQNIYVCTTAGTIAGGSVTLPFAALIPGPTPVPPTNGITIYQTINGWSGVTVASGVLGNLTESRSAFEARRQQTVAAGSVGPIAAILGSVLKAPGVIDAYVNENNANTSVTIGGFTLAPHSVYVCASGGLDADVAHAAWLKKGPGSFWNGSTTVTVVDTNPIYNPPFPTYQVSFQRPAPLPFLFAISIINSPIVPSNATQLIQNAIVAAFAGADGGPRAKIGATVLGTRFYAPVIALGPWAQVISILLGSPNTPSASFTAAIAGPTMTVSAVASGTIAIGQTVVDAAGLVAPGTTITGGAGVSWTVSIPQTVGSEAMQSAIAASTSVVTQINQVPSISPANIKVVAI